MALYRDLLNAGVPLDHHESDLCAALTPQSRAILAKYPDQPKEYFTVQAGHPNTGQPWCYLSFAYAPFWEQVEARAAELSARIKGEASAHV